MVKCSPGREDREVCGEVSDASAGLGILHKSVGGLREPVAISRWLLSKPSPFACSRGEKSA